MNVGLLLSIYYSIVFKKKYESIGVIRGGSYLSSDTRLEYFLRGVKYLANNLRCMKISREIIRGVKI